MFERFKWLSSCHVCLHLLKWYTTSIQSCYLCNMIFDQSFLSAAEILFFFTIDLSATELLIWHYCSFGYWNSFFFFFDTIDLSIAELTFWYYCSLSCWNSFFKLLFSELLNFFNHTIVSELLGLFSYTIVLRAAEFILWYYCSLSC